MKIEYNLLKRGSIVTVIKNNSVRCSPNYMYLITSVVKKDTFAIMDECGHPCGIISASDIDQVLLYDKSTVIKNESTIPDSTQLYPEIDRLNEKILNYCDEGFIDEQSLQAFISYDQLRLHYLRCRIALENEEKRNREILGISETTDEKQTKQQEITEFDVKDVYHTKVQKFKRDYEEQALECDLDVPVSNFYQSESSATVNNVTSNTAFIHPNKKVRR